MPTAVPSTRPRLDALVAAAGTTTTISVRGDLDLAVAWELAQVLRQVLRTRPEIVALDLARVSFVDTAGVHAVLDLHARAVARGVRLVLVEAAAPVQRTFTLCGAASRLPFVPAG